MIRSFSDVFASDGCLTTFGLLHAFLAAVPHVPRPATRFNRVADPDAQHYISLLRLTRGKKQVHAQATVMLQPLKAAFVPLA